MDLLWLGVIARDFYRDNLGHLLAPEVNWPAAILFYLLFILGILYFAVVPALCPRLPMARPWQRPPVRLLYLYDL